MSNIRLMKGLFCKLRIGYSRVVGNLGVSLSYSGIYFDHELESIDE